MHDALSYHTRLIVAAFIFSFAFALTATAQTDGELEHCDQPLGTLAVVEPQEGVIRALSRYDLNSPTSLIRMMVQQSNCFLVVERGVAMQNMMQERELAASGQLRQGENVGAGQMEAADFILTPHVIFSEGNSGGVSGAARNLLGRRNRTVGRLAGGLKFKEAQTSILVSDARSGIQIAAAEGHARKTDFSLRLLRWGGGTSSDLGGYTNTNEGKVIAASFLDNFNNVVVSIRSNPNLQRPVEGAGQAPGDARAGATFMEGDVLYPKIDNVQILSQPSAGSGMIGRVNKMDELVFLGEEKDGFIYVVSSNAEGWVKTALVGGN